MGRKKKGKPREPSRPRGGEPVPAPSHQQTDAPAPAAPRRRYRLVTAGLGVAAVLAVGLWWVFGGRGGGGGRVVLPPPSTPARPVTDSVTYADFVGSDACAECHETQYAQWVGSTHGQAGGPPSRDRVIAPFNGRPIRFRDATVTPSVDARGVYNFTVRQDEREPVVLRVDGVIGKGHMVGGGTQGFVSAFPDGTVRFLPFDYSRHEALWFCNTDAQGLSGFTPITPDMPLAECGDWPPNRILGTNSEFTNCQQCHGSQITVRFDPGAHRYGTAIKSLSVNCESCHGPGRRHVELARAGPPTELEDLDVLPLGTLDKDASLEVCFQCHSLKGVLEPGYLPGKALLQHYSLKAPLIGDEPFFPDGRVQTFAYQQNHLYSDCYLNGSMTCVDCHDPHSQGYRDIYGRILASRFADGQCLDCHASKAADVSAHTKHDASSEGSRCVACHMPYLQHPLLGDRVQYRRSDHTIPIPRPAFDAGLGIESACATCHQDQTVEALQQQTTALWGELKPHKGIVADLAALRDGRRADVLGLVERLDAPHPMAVMAALNQLMARHLRPNMPQLETEVLEALTRLARHDDVDVQALALTALHYARGEDPAIRRLLAKRLASIGDEEVEVRRRWVVSLGFFGDAYRSRGDYGNAIVVYRKALEVLPRHPGVLLNLGAAYTDAGNLESALETYEQTLADDPDQPLALIGAGVVLERLGRTAEAVSAYRRAIAIKPSEALAHVNLGNIHLRRNEFREAIEAYRLAVQYRPRLARAYFNLGRAYIMVNELENALAAARNAVQFEPDDASARQMLADLEQAVGGR